MTAPPDLDACAREPIHTPGLLLEVAHHAVGLGEGEDHLAPFEVESFVDALLG